MNVNIAPSWQTQLKEEFEKPYFKDLVDFVKKEYKNYHCLPKGKEIFNAMNYTPFDKVKVVIMGQDPYPTPGHAHGLCFSVKEDVKPFPASLKNIFKEIETDLGNPFPENGSLIRWAEQGVLLLNAVLTVRSGQPRSHQGKGWEIFTNQIIKKISDEKENVVFLLWGGDAKKKRSLIDSSKHLILESGHPSPLSANRGYWFGNKHFSKTNNFLQEKGLEKIIW
ncbi:MAG TPA: uracil-DNA glycosylase [Flavobacteriia bacterium]|jgi:uracil-DNA glycosylase|nr:uracil-DNA glycosylase [Flavobacteriia bacterium]